MDSPPDSKGIDRWIELADHSWVERLKVDPEHEKFYPNKSSREVKSGHYVPVRPTKLPKPNLVTFSAELATELGLSKKDCQEDPRFTLFFSGNMDAIESQSGETVFQSWATPYALAIYGQDMYHNCPFGTGNGYGDGRAVSIGEIVLPDGHRWEFQLKGGGTTPFCRGGDGRAVLRSSIREFLVSEAMFHLGVSTTRALSLIESLQETVKRPWFSPNRSVSREPDVMIANKAAITTRVAPSFLRLGHLQLFERRVRRNKEPEQLPKKMNELRLLVEHCLFREYPHINTAAKISDLPDKVVLTPESSIKEMKQFLEQNGVNIEGCYEKSDLYEKVKAFPRPVLCTPPEVLYGPLQPRILQMLREASDRFAQLMANWQRVGFCQGNFNSDNCLIAGRTMDYGPFGFMELYDPSWCMWTGGAPHFSWGNQPMAGIKNFNGFASAVRPLLDDEGAQELANIVRNHVDNTNNTVKKMWASKLGLLDHEDTHQFFTELENSFLRAFFDYTIFWRNLPKFIETFYHETLSDVSDMDLLGPIYECFYEDPCRVDDWGRLLRRYLELVKTQRKDTPVETIVKEMRLVSPKYVPREWMLVNAYTLAAKGDFSNLLELQNLFLHPYDEQTPEMEQKYYKKAPKDNFSGVGKGGEAFMT